MMITRGLYIPEQGKNKQKINNNAQSDSHWAQKSNWMSMVWAPPISNVVIMCQFSLFFWISAIVKTNERGVADIFVLKQRERMDSQHDWMTLHMIYIRDLASSSTLMGLPQPASSISKESG